MDRGHIEWKKTMINEIMDIITSDNVLFYTEDDKI